MNSPNPLPQSLSADPPAAIPWYKSQVLQGIVVAVVSQGLLRLKAQFGIDLTIYGIDANAASLWIMDAISAGALAYAARARVTKLTPTVTANKAGAAAINNPETPK